MRWFSWVGVFVIFEVTVVLKDVCCKGLDCGVIKSNLTGSEV